MIVKVQLPIAGDMSQALVYDEKRSIQTFIPVTASLLEAMDGRLKVYFRVSCDEEQKRLLVEAEIESQEW